MKGVRLVVLDIDDTLYLERDYVRSGFLAVGRFVAERHGIDGFGEECWDIFKDGMRHQVFDVVAASLGLEVNVPELVGVYRTHSPEISLTRDSIRFLRNWRDCLMLAAVTDGPSASQRAKITALELERFISEVVVTDERGPEWTKPSELAFELLQELFRVKPGEAMYVGDNPAKDLEPALKLGWASVRVRRLGALHRDVPTPAGSVEIASLDELTALLG